MSVIGWLVDEAQRPGLLDRFRPIYEKTIAHHVTLRANVPDDAPLPPEATAQIVGEADDGKGVQALVVELDGATGRPDGSTYHITCRWRRAARRARATTSSATTAGRRSRARPCGSSPAGSK